MRVKFNFGYLPFVLTLMLLVLAGHGLGSDQPLTYTKPESMGFSSQKLEQLASFLPEAGSSALLLMVDGKVIFEWGAVNKKYTIHSIRKALLNSLFGIKVSQGVIDLSSTIEELRIDDIKPSLSAKEKRARIIDLLKSRSGIYHSAAGVSKGMLEGKPKRGSHAPDEHFYYNNWDFNVLGAIIEQKTKKSIYKLFYEEIAKPLGMTTYKGTYTSIDGESKDAVIPDTDGFYQYEKSKSKYPAYHFRMTARDLARYGLLYLNQGNWKGKQIIPREWIKKSTQPYSIFNQEYGIAYGMLWYVLTDSKTQKSHPFFHTGAGVHMLGVYPASKLVLVHRVNTEAKHSFKTFHLYKILDLVFAARVK
jgi:CubicO group peptidase (beta-lactamase class C family)